jgi:hypothetical protein
MSDEFKLPELSPLELHKIVVLDEASRLSSLSVDALEENYAHLIIALSPRRRGMRQGHALMLGKKMMLGKKKFA